MMTRSILLTGFEPFDGEQVNPSQEIVRALDGEQVDGCRVIGAILPVAFEAIVPTLAQLLATHRPALVLALGQAGGRSELSLERVAVNLIDARIADNAGAQPVDQPVVADAPRAYFTMLPVKAIARRLHELGIPAALSLSAGTYVCNQTFFALTHLLTGAGSTTRGGLMHVPWLPEQAAHRPGQPSMALDTMVRGVRATLQCALATRDELRAPGGATH